MSISEKYTSVQITDENDGIEEIAQSDEKNRIIKITKD
jgi:hypothetical protein